MNIQVAKRPAGAARGAAACGRLGRLRLKVGAACGRRGPDAPPYDCPLNPREAYAWLDGEGPPRQRIPDGGRKAGAARPDGEGRRSGRRCGGGGGAPALRQEQKAALAGANRK